MIKTAESCEPAMAIVNKAKEMEYISGPLPVVPELVEHEKLLFSVVAKLMREHVRNKMNEELDSQEIYLLFLFIYAKAGETAWHWHAGDDFTVRPQGIFSEKIPFDVNKEMLEYFNGLSVPMDLFDAFQQWRANNQDYCAKNGVHPALPLLDALKWMYRISLGLGLEFLGYEEE